MTPCEARSGHWRVFAARPFEAHELVEAGRVAVQVLRVELYLRDLTSASFQESDVQRVCAVAWMPMAVPFTLSSLYTGLSTCRGCKLSHAVSEPSCNAICTVVGAEVDLETCIVPQLQQTKFPE